jgi:hypothetical protein
MIDIVAMHLGEGKSLDLFTSVFGDEAILLMNTKRR